MDSVTEVLNDKMIKCCFMSQRFKIVPQEEPQQYLGGNMVVTAIGVI
jgi:hypothetical protein